MRTTGAPEHPTRRYLDEVTKLPEYQWLKPLVPKLEDNATSLATANQINEKNREIGAMLRTTVSQPCWSRPEGHIIPNSAEAQVDVAPSAE